MILQAAQKIGAGLSTFGLAGAGVGIGLIFASLIIALTYLGAEDAQLFMQIPAAVGFVFQGLVLFYLLGAELLVNYKIVLRKRV